MRFLANAEEAHLLPAGLDFAHERQRAPQDLRVERAGHARSPVIGTIATAFTTSRR